MTTRDVIILAPEQVTYLPGNPLIGFSRRQQPQAPEPVGDVADVAALLGAVRRRHLPAQRGIRRLEIRLARPMVQVRELTGLPPVSEPDLKRLVAQRAQRFFRRSEGASCTDAVWIGRREKGMSRAALAVVAEEALITSLEGSAETHGWLVDRITLDGPADERRLRLCSPSGEARRRKRHRAIARRFLMGALAGTILLGVAGIARFQVLSQRVTVRLVTLRQPAEAAAKLRLAMDEAGEMLAAIEIARKAQGRLLAPLARIANVLPDSAVLSSFTVDEAGKGELSGHAYRALEVLAALSHLELGRPQVAGSLTRETVAGHNWERFTVRFDVAP